MARIIYSAGSMAALARRLGLFDATMLVMGGIVGSGIFMNPYVVARQVHTPFLILGAWVLGGLNYQIEHHLFPRVAHTHYPRIAEIVKRNAAKHGVRYTAQPSLWIALRSHHRHLRRLGRLGVPVEIEMG